MGGTRFLKSEVCHQSLVGEKRIAIQCAGRHVAALKQMIVDWEYIYGLVIRCAGGP